MERTRPWRGSPWLALADLRWLCSVPGSVMLWVGSESEMSGERDVDLMELVADFVQAKGLPPGLPAQIVHQGEEDEAADFWDFFIN